jgi:hypothetical protein
MSVPSHILKACSKMISPSWTRQAPDPADIRRSKAIGILAQPAQALQLLYQHQDNNWEGPDEPADLETAPDLDQNDPDQTLAWPGSKTSAPCFYIGCASCSVIIAASA